MHGGGVTIQAGSSLRCCDSLTYTAGLLCRWWAGEDAAHCAANPSATLQAADAPKMHVPHHCKLPWFHSIVFDMLLPHRQLSMSTARHHDGAA
jgi:hypothetical protein